MAIAALVTAILGVALPVGFVGLALGLVALSRATNRPAEYGGRRLALAGARLGAATGLLWCLGAALLAVVKAREDRSPQAVRQDVAIYRLDVIGNVLRTYAVDNHGSLPEAGSDWKKRLFPRYLTTTEVFDIPDAPPGVVAIHYVPRRQMPDVAERAKLVLAYVDPDALPGRFGLVLYADGRVAKVSRTELETIVRACSGQDDAR